MITILNESRKDFENLYQAMGAVILSSALNDVYEKYVRIRQGLPERYRDVTQVTKIFKDYKRVWDMYQKFQDIQLKLQSIIQERPDLDTSSIQSELDEVETRFSEVEDTMKVYSSLVNDFVQTVDNYQSNSEIDRQIKAGVKVIGKENGWTVYRITTPEAAQKYGKGTTWCISGNYPGHEDEANYWFNNYKETNKITGYYFLIHDSFTATNAEEAQKQANSKWAVLRAESTDFSQGKGLEMFNASQSEKETALRWCLTLNSEDVPAPIPWHFILDKEWLDTIGANLFLGEDLIEGLYDIDMFDIHGTYAQMFPDMSFEDVFEEGYITKEAYKKAKKSLQKVYIEDYLDNQYEYDNEISTELTADELAVFDEMSNEAKIEVLKNFDLINYSYEGVLKNPYEFIATNRTDKLYKRFAEVNIECYEEFIRRSIPDYVANIEIYI